MRRAHVRKTLGFVGIVGTMSMSPIGARGQLVPQQLEPLTTPAEAAPAVAAVAVNIDVSKTAFVDGQNVCGEIRIRNTGATAVSVSNVVDSLEVHFPRKATIPPSLPAGSTREWFKVATVPLPPPWPGPIAPGDAATIPYCFSLCLAADSPGANSMRNVVTVTVINESGSAKTVTTRSVSFPPPVLDCQACCLPNGSCADTVPGACAADGGLPRGAGTDCGTTECPEACCHSDGPCTDEGASACRDAAGEPQGPGTDCDSSQCCIPPATSGCTDEFDCCNTFQSCPAGVCCGETGVTGACGDDAHCCDRNATCNSGTCCLPVFRSGCTTDSDCCSGLVCGSSGTCEGVSGP